MKYACVVTTDNVVFPFPADAAWVRDQVLASGLLAGKPADMEEDDFATLGRVRHPIGFIGYQLTGEKGLADAENIPSA